jgi:hypothetical protein
VARHLSLLLAALLAGSAAQAQEPPRSVEVKGMKNPQMRSYRAIVAGLDAFTKHHALAPAVDQLRFQLEPTQANKDPAVDGITMHIVGKGEPIAVPVDAAGLYTIPRDETARRDNADLILNRKKDLFEGRVVVRSPGLASNVRRVGDLRLECQATVAIVKEEIPFLVNTFINGVFGSTNWCATDGFEWDMRAGAPLSAATLVAGERRKALKVHGSHADMPVGDRSWPDDALVELDYTTPPTSL